MHNIKYIISVDDCFFSRKKEDMKAIIYSKMCDSLDPFRTILSSYHENDLVAEIDEMKEGGIDCSALISSLLDGLSDEDLLRCYEACEKNGVTYAEERDSILSFLQSLKEGGRLKHIELSHPQQRQTCSTLKKQV